MSDRAATGAGRHKYTAEQVLELNKLFTLKLAWLVKMHHIPQSMTFAADETCCTLWDVGNRTYAETGSKEVKLIGADEKKAITVMLTVSAAGLMLKTQFIWTGKSGLFGAVPSELPVLVNRNNALHCQTETHWQKPSSMITYVEKVLIPHVCSSATSSCLSGSTPV